MGAESLKINHRLCFIFFKGIDIQSKVKYKDKFY